LRRVAADNGGTDAQARIVTPFGVTRFVVAVNAAICMFQISTAQRYRAAKGNNEYCRTEHAFSPHPASAPLRYRAAKGNNEYCRTEHALKRRNL